MAQDVFYVFVNLGIPFWNTFLASGLHVFDGVSESLLRHLRSEIFDAFGIVVQDI